MRTSQESEMLEKWDKAYPQYSPNKEGVRLAVVRCVFCLKPLPNGEKCGCQDKGE